MRKSRYSPEQVAFGLRQAEEGSQVAEVCRKIGMSEQTFYRSLVGGRRRGFRGWVWRRCAGCGSWRRRTAS